MLALSGVEGMAWARRGVRRSHVVRILFVSAAVLFFADVSPSAAAQPGSDSAAVSRGAQSAPEVGEMEPRLAEALNAFGSGRYEECRELAEALVGRAFPRPPQTGAEAGATAGGHGNARPTGPEQLTKQSISSDTRAECARLIILSHLHQGDFAAAREAADRLHSVSPDVCQDLLAQVNREERDYQTEVTRLQRIVATSKDPEAVARAQLRTAGVHQIFGRLERAEQSYRKVADGHPQATEAPTALAQIAGIQYRMGRREEAEQSCWETIRRFPNSFYAGGAIARIAAWHRERGDEEGALGACEKAIDLAPDSEAAASACEAIYRSQLRPGPNTGTQAGAGAPTPAGVSYEPVRQRLAQIEARHPGSRASDAARFGIGELYLAEGIPEMAERVWKDMIAARSQPSTQSLEILDAAEDALLALLYNRGREEAESGELGRAIADLDYVVMQQRWEGDRSQLFAELGDMCQVGSQWDDAIGYYQAALDHDPTPAMAEMVRFKAAICHFNAKRYQQAESAFEDLLKREPRAHVAEESRRFLELCRSPEKRPSEAEQR